MVETVRKLKWRVVWVLLFLLGIAAAFIIGFFSRPQTVELPISIPEPPPEPVPVITSDIIAQQIRGISEHSTLEYFYTNVGKFEETMDFYGWQVPFTTKSFILSYDGVMKLGINTGNIQVELTEDEIRLTLPDVEILSHEIYEDTLEVLDQSKNIFNQIEIQDYASFATDQKKIMEEKVRGSSRFQEAESRAKQQLEDFLRVIPDVRDNYTIVFVEPSAPGASPASSELLESSESSSESASASDSSALSAPESLSAQSA